MKPIMNCNRLLVLGLSIAIVASLAPAAFGQDLLPSKKDLIKGYEIDNGVLFLVWNKNPLVRVPIKPFSSFATSG